MCCIHVGVLGALWNVGHISIVLHPNNGSFGCKTCGNIGWEAVVIVLCD